MDTAPLQPLIRRFVEALSSGADPLIAKQLEQHRRRKETAAHLLQAGRIPSLTREELEAFIQDMDAWYGLRMGKDAIWKRVFGEENSRLPALREALADLVRRGEAGITAQDFCVLQDALPGFGPAYLSEALALRFPDRYWLWNKQVRSFLDAQGVDLKGELPWGKKGDPGEEYVAAGRHLMDLRRALSEASGQPVDQLTTDLFIYWANQQKPDPWAGEIARLRDEMPPERLQVREENERLAQELIESKLGQFEQNDIRQWLDYLSTDWDNGELCHSRLGTLARLQARRIVQAAPAFNAWVERLWRAADAELDGVLDEFWARGDLPGAGITLPTVVLYLRDPQRYNMWRDYMAKALQAISGYEPGRRTTAAEYRRYNAALSEFRDRYHLAPRSLDHILWRLYGLSKAGGAEAQDAPPEMAEEDAPADEALYTLAQLQRDTFLDRPFWAEAQALLRDKKQIVFYGPPGTGKTWVARRFARYWVEGALDPRGEVQVVQFHPSYAYEEFVEGIRPQSVEGPDGRRELSYPVKAGVFRRFCEQARANPGRRYVLILDEINRGELPRILGELLYLLEYRQESVVLPYSGEPFSVPENVYLIGTMNTADRSIALVDHALRRRFHFVPLRAKPEILRAYFEANGTAEMAWVADLLELANHQLEQDGIEWHLHIGHSHFMRSDLDEARLLLTWKHSILPTLEEYFYRQPERLKAYQLEALKQALGRA